MPEKKTVKNLIMNINLEFEKPAGEQAQTEARAIADRLLERLQPLAEVIDQAGARLTLYYEEGAPCRLIIDAPVEIQKEVSDLAGPANTWR